MEEPVTTLTPDFKYDEKGTVFKQAHALRLRRARVSA